MGSYLDKPETTKKSAFDQNDYLEIGSSSMQGWRINQEDAHNAIPQLADNASFFAVYDGHGGSEVAEYCSMKLPDFLKQLESFKNGNYEEALKEAFMGFDHTLLGDSVVEELRQLAKKNPDYEDSDMDDMEDEETAEEIINLHQEASMPLNEVLEKYKGNTEKISRIQSVQQIISFQSKSSSHNKNDSEAGPSASGSCSHSSKKVESSSSVQQAASDNEVSSSSGKTTNSDESEKNEPSSSNSQPSNQTPDSTLVIIPSSSKNDESSSSNEPKSMKPEQSSKKDSINQESECSSNGTVSESKKEEDAITSTKENGEIGSCSSSTSVNVSSNSPKKSTEKTVTKSSEIKQNIDDDESESSDDEHDETYKESPKNKIQQDDSDEEDEDDEDVYDEDDDEELSNEEISGEEDDDEDGLDDAFMSSMETGPAKASGCTAVVALLIGRDLYVANAGDSRCIVSRAGKVVEMSFDHKPEDQIEFQRIRKAGGRVTMDGRVNGGLNLSRAIGDHGYKMNKELPAEDQMITAMPDLKKVTLTEEDEFMVLACDGIWNYMSNEEVVGFVKHRIDAGKLSLTQICEELFHNCLAPNTLGDGTGCDNMTAIIVKFKPTLFKLPTAQKDVSNSEAECIAHKRAHEEDGVADKEHTDKKQKLDDDLTPSTVDTSS
ncbi:unnamed protein product [Chironomus riparius]|uniref:protein-serine/threonine phosphatase n=1 Tax=Chironomus riparius TaxID=315576 RepID=A0A9N9S2V0_9DIPT|nr:unnamed protein product [Chironomus riparius]